ncbi:SMI1/KNR4 family protein [Actinomadura violacea]|uniref:SMI1/KNR4 family protein n=1 Tax=Actinomadura violacea TaxID=2819934 RepID=A0ABS3RHQ2_9ACTN|nr:SMI1/KNR4 family protein [Actinomadura violacea]MBO2456251.1 SMI1/KNR4 family protein [Actinomadura violacea]
MLRLLAPGGDDGFGMEAEERGREQPHEDARLWGVFAGGETCCWLPFGDDPAHWLVALDGHGNQQLNLSTTEFLDEWLDGRLDLPVLSLPPVPRERTLTRAGDPVAAPADPVREGVRDPLAQLRTIIGPGRQAVYDWEAIERELGVPGLPADYKRLYETYGAGGRFAVNGIFVQAPNDLAAHLKEYGHIYREWAENKRNPASPDRRYKAYPESGGLLYCGSTEGRDVLCWDTADPDPDRWPVVNLGYREIEEFGPLTELLVAELTGVGLDMTDASLGDPAEWAWPYWGPRPPRA